jgi:hypothetical protein
MIHKCVTSANALGLDSHHTLLECEVLDGNKSLYLVFVGVIFLSILDCF